jgi:tetrahydromethanopterin S-methyltransferase subunit G
MKSKIKDIGFLAGIVLLILIFDIARAINKILRGSHDMPSH